MLTNDPRERFAQLSAEKQALVHQRLRERRSRTGLEPARPLAPARARDGAAPLSFAQRRMWFLHQLEPASTAYNVPSAVRIAGVLDPAALETSVREIVRRHEILRTRFLEAGGEPFQAVAAEARLTIPLADLSALPECVRASEASRLANRLGSIPFDLTAGRPLRAAVLRLARDDHVVILVLHHIVCDGWSLGVLAREFAMLYAAAVGREPARLPAPGFQYADVAAQEHEWLSGSDVQADLDYWTGHLAGVPTRLDLPTDRPRPAVQTYRGAVRRIELPADVTRHLAELCARERVTLFMALLAIWQALLTRYSGQSQVIVGVPIAGRTGAEMEGLIGLFVNTLPVRGDLSGNPSFRQLLARVREATLDAQTHHRLPLERLVQAVQPERSPDQSPLFQVLFVQVSFPGGSPDLPGARCTPFAVENRASIVDLTLILGDMEGRPSLALEYNTDLFDGATIERLTRRLVTLLERAVREPDRPIGTISIVSDSELREILDAARREPTGVGTAGAGCIHEMFEANVDRSPDAIAMVCRDQAITYAALDRQACRLARHLQENGVFPGMTVAILLRREPSLVAAILGILKNGAAFLPIDPGTPRQRVGWMLEDAGVSVVVTCEPLVDCVPAGDHRVLVLDRLANEISRLSAARFPCAIPPEALAYVIFTSGSTGRPKGVMVPHVALANWLVGTGRDRRIEEGTGAPVAGSLGVDMTLSNLLSPLLAGRRVLLLPEEPGIETLGQLARREQGLSMVTLTPGQLDLLAAQMPASLATGWTRLITVGGEMVHAASLAFWRAHAPETRILNEYGPTETTLCCTTYEIPKDAELPARIPIGRPLPGMSAYVLDDNGLPVPSDVPGELYVGGIGVAWGYASRPELTAAVFVPDPFASAPGARTYRTGDRVRRLPDGNLDFLGRVDDQVKIRGFRVELGEVEATLAAHPGIRAVAAAVRADATGASRLVAYTVPRDPQGPDQEELRLFLRARLPEYMIPALFMSMKALPLAAGGKVDRRALPAPTHVARSTRATRATPDSPTQEILAGIWARALGIDRPGVDEDFFELGGHSLIATVVMSRVRAAFRIELPLRALFEAPTIAKLSRVIEATMQGDSAAESVPIARVPRDGLLPLSFGQERLWFLHRLHPESAAYHLPTVIDLAGGLQVTALESSVQALLHRHEALRTRYEFVDGMPSQRVDPPGADPLALVDLSGLVPVDCERAARSIVDGAISRPFVLARESMRTALLRMACDAHRYVMVMHHITTDEWSMHLLVREMASNYLSGPDRVAAGRPPLPVQYVDFAVWQRRTLAGERLERELDWWRDVLHEAPVLDLPTDHPRPPGWGHPGAMAVLQLPAELAREVRELGLREGTTLFMTMLAAFAMLLCRYAGTDDLVIGTPASGRTREELEDVVGFFVNTLALRLRPEGHVTVREFLAQVRASCLDAFGHQELPFERVVEDLHPGREPGRHPLFDVMFALQADTVPPPAIPGLHIEARDAESATARFDLTMLVHQDGGELACRLEYRTDLFEAETITVMLEQYRAILEGMVAGPDLAIDRLPEPSGQSVGWNAAPAGRPRDIGLTEPVGRPALLRLASPEHRRRVEPERAAPRTSTEERIAAIWAEVLGIEPPGIHDDFFTLGGHSLTAMQVLARVEALCHVALPLRSLFESPTVAGVSALVDTAAAAAGTPDGTTIMPGDPASHQVLSFAQQRLWFLDRLEPGNPAYKIPLGIRVRGELDVESLEGALQEIVRRHAVLRTRFVVQDGRLLQVADPSPDLRFGLIDLQGLPEPERERAVIRCCEADAARAFDLERGPVIRAMLIRTAPPEHVFVVNVHHAACDGWSIGILVREMTALYTAFSAGLPSPLAEPPIQYADFARWQRDVLRGPLVEEQLAYWKSQLAGVAALELPVDRPRRDVQTYAAGSHALELSAACANALRDLSRRAGASLFMTMMAAFQVLLHRLTGQTDITVGTPTAGRGRAQTEGLIGCFLNTMAVRCDLTGEPTFADVLAQVRATVLAGTARQDVPFEMLLETTRPVRDLSRTPLFQALFNMLSFGHTVPAVPGLTVAALAAPPPGSKFDLTVYATEHGRGIRLDLVYNRDLFADGRMREFLDQYGVLLQGVAATPDRSIASIPLDTPRARVVLPDPRHDLDRSWRGPIDAYVARHARNTPHRIAVEDARRAWTYAELEERVRRLADLLRANGLGPRDVVAIRASRRLELVWAMLGVLRGDAAFLVLDAEHPDAWLAERVRAIEPRAWINLPANTDLPPLVRQAASATCRWWLDLDAGAPLPDAAPVNAPDATNVTDGPDRIAYVAFTSGSTGSPSAVLGSHGTLSHFMPFMQRRFELSAADRFSMLAGLPHDPLHRDIFTPLSLGACLCIPDDEDILAGGLAHWMARSGITVANMPPVMARILAESAHAGSLPALRRVFFYGDALTWRHVAGMRRVAPHAALVNLYGATETARALGFWCVPDAGDTVADGVVPVGEGIEDAQILVMVSDMRRAAIGERGEIYLRSPHLAIGYRGDEERTRRRFVVNPYTGREGDRMYRTGDLGRYRADGQVEIVGRADHQVKIRGFRIEPEEIEAALVTHESVREAAVTVADDPGGDRRLVAWIATSGNVSTLALRRHLRQRLPAYMLPADIMQLDRLPRTVSGKVDRRALRDRQLRTGREAAVSTPPSTPTERLVADVWRRTLGVEHVDLEHNFFDLGGQSVQSIAVIDQLKQRLGVSVRTRDLFLQTLGQLAASLDAQHDSGAAVDVAPSETP